MIREFNLNELFQKSKKLNKVRGSKGDELNYSQPDDDSKGLHPDTDGPDQAAESKKDQ